MRINKDGFILIEALILFLVVILVVSVLLQLPKPTQKDDLYDNEKFETYK